jgi:hypothetical protein
VTTERSQASASEALLTGEVAEQWAQVHLVLLDGATVELKVPDVAGVSWGAYAPTPDEPPSIAVIADSGALPPGVPLPRTSSTVRIEAAHGTRDPVIPFAAGQATARLFEAAGYRVHFSPVQLAGHALSGTGHTVARACRRAQPRQPSQPQMPPVAPVGEGGR